MSNSKQLSKAQLRAKARTKKQNQSYIMMAVGAIIIVAVLIIVNQPGELIRQLEAYVPRTHPNTNWNGMGDPNAPVTLIEYSDFLCGHCKNFFLEKEQILINEYIAQGKVYFIYRPFSNTEFSVNGAQAAYCAGDQNKFWEMHDVLFSLNAIDFTSKNLEYIAEAIGLEIDTFKDCMQNDKYIELIQQDMTEGREAGVGSTPNFVINGEVVIEGNQPWENFVQAIDAALAEAEAKTSE